MSIEVLKLAEEALVSLNAEALVSLYADDFLFEDTSTKDRITDKIRLKEYFGQLFSLPEVGFSNIAFFGLGERGAGEWTWGGRSLKSGKEYAIRGASLFKIEGNRIKEEKIFYDPRSAYE